MDVSIWMALQSAMQEGTPRRPASRATVRRIAAYARPHRRTLVGFLALSTLGAALGVATPVLAGLAVDAVVAARPLATVVGLATLIGLLAVAEAGVGMVERLQSAKLGEGLILDLRRTVFD
ncbi:MAG: ABC transporter ATP-binding protein, partial [Acidimicrobiales bacterium]